MKRKQPSNRRNEQPRSAAEEIDRREQSLDDALKGTFPASDPPAAVIPHGSQE